VAPLNPDPALDRFLDQVRWAASLSADSADRDGNLISRRAGIALLLMLAVQVVGSVYSCHRLRNPPAYRRFADHRSFLGIPNFGAVASNLPFAVMGLWGLGC
jgi:hypothetical protein